MIKAPEAEWSGTDMGSTPTAHRSLIPSVLSYYRRICEVVGVMSDETEYATSWSDEVRVLRHIKQV